MLSKGARKILLDAADLLEKNKWTTGTLAKKSNGRSYCSVFDEKANCFCMLGAMARVSDKKFHGNNFSEGKNGEGNMLLYKKGKASRKKVNDPNLHEVLLHLSKKYAHYHSLYDLNDRFLKNKKKVIKFLRENAND